MNIEITADKRGLIVKTPYSSQFVSELKRLVPASDRQFDGESKAWIVSPAHGARFLRELANATGGMATTQATARLNELGATVRLMIGE